MGVTPLTVKLPEILYDLLCEIGSITQSQIDTEGKNLPSIQSGDIVKEQLPIFGQQMFTLGKKKEAEEEDAVGMEDELAEVRLNLEMSALFSMLTLIIYSMLTPAEACNDHLVAKVCKGYQIALRLATDPENSESSDDDDEAGNEPVAKTPDRKKLH